MRDYVDVGPCPVNEDAAQCGDTGFDAANRDETLRYMRLIEKTVGTPPEGASLCIRSHSHDYGTYREVAVRFSDLYPLAIDYAYHVESHAPTTWTGEDAVPWNATEAAARIAAPAETI